MTSQSLHVSCELPADPVFIGGDKKFRGLAVTTDAISQVLSRFGTRIGGAKDAAETTAESSQRKSTSLYRPFFAADAKEPLVKPPPKPFKFKGDEDGYTGDADSRLFRSRYYQRSPLEHYGETKGIDSHVDQSQEAESKTYKHFWQDPKERPKMLIASAASTVLSLLLIRNVKSNIDTTQELNANIQSSQAQQQAAEQQAIAESAAREASGFSNGARLERRHASSSISDLDPAGEAITENQVNIVKRFNPLTTIRDNMSSVSMAEGFDRFNRFIDNLPSDVKKLVFKYILGGGAMLGTGVTFLWLYFRGRHHRHDPSPLPGTYIQPSSPPSHAPAPSDKVIHTQVYKRSIDATVSVAEIHKDAKPLVDEVAAAAANSKNRALDPSMQQSKPQARSKQGGHLVKRDLVVSHRQDALEGQDSAASEKIPKRTIEVNHDIDSSKQDSAGSSTLHRRLADDYNEMKPSVFSAEQYPKTKLALVVGASVATLSWIAYKVIDAHKHSKEYDNRDGGLSSGPLKLRSREEEVPRHMLSTRMAPSDRAVEMGAVSVPVSETEHPTASRAHELMDELARWKLPIAVTALVTASCAVFAATVHELIKYLRHHVADDGGDQQDSKPALSPSLQPHERRDVSHRQTPLAGTGVSPSDHHPTKRMFQMHQIAAFPPPAAHEAPEVSARVFPIDDNDHLVVPHEAAEVAEEVQAMTPLAVAGLTAAGSVFIGAALTALGYAVYKMKDEFHDIRPNNAEATRPSSNRRNNYSTVEAANGHRYTLNKRALTGAEAGAAIEGVESIAHAAPAAETLHPATATEQLDSAHPLAHWHDPAPAERMFEPSYSAQEQARFRQLRRINRAVNVALTAGIVVGVPSLMALDYHYANADDELRTKRRKELEILVQQLRQERTRQQQHKRDLGKRTLTPATLGGEVEAIAQAGKQGIESATERLGSIDVPTPRRVESTRAAPRLELAPTAQRVEPVSAPRRPALAPIQYEKEPFELSRNQAEALFFLTGISAILGGLTVADAVRLHEDKQRKGPDTNDAELELRDEDRFLKAAVGANSHQRRDLSFARGTITNRQESGSTVEAENKLTKRTAATAVASGVEKAAEAVSPLAQEGGHQLDTATGKLILAASAENPVPVAVSERLNPSPAASAAERSASAPVAERQDSVSAASAAQRRARFRMAARILVSLGVTTTIAAAYVAVFEGINAVEHKLDNIHQRLEEEHMRKLDALIKQIRAGRQRQNEAAAARQQPHKRDLAKRGLSVAEAGAEALAGKVEDIAQAGKQGVEAAVGRAQTAAAPERPALALPQQAPAPQRSVYAPIRTEDKPIMHMSDAQLTAFGVLSVSTALMATVLGLQGLIVGAEALGNNPSREEAEEVIKEEDHFRQKSHQQRHLLADGRAISKRGLSLADATNASKDSLFAVRMEVQQWWQRKVAARRWNTRRPLLPVQHLGAGGSTQRARWNPHVKEVATLSAVAAVAWTGAWFSHLAILAAKERRRDRQLQRQNAALRKFFAEYEQAEREEAEHATGSHAALSKRTLPFRRLVQGLQIVGRDLERLTSGRPMSRLEQQQRLKRLRKYIVLGGLFGTVSVIQFVLLHDLVASHRENKYLQDELRKVRQQLLNQQQQHRDLQSGSTRANALSKRGLGGYVTSKATCAWETLKVAKADFQSLGAKETLSTEARQARNERFHGYAAFTGKLVVGKLIEMYVTYEALHMYHQYKDEKRFREESQRIQQLETQQRQHPPHTQQSLYSGAGIVAPAAASSVTPSRSGVRPSAALQKRGVSGVAPVVEDTMQATREVEGVNPLVMRKWRQAGARAKWIAVGTLATAALVVDGFAGRDSWCYYHDNEAPRFCTRFGRLLHKRAAEADPQLAKRGLVEKRSAEVSGMQDGHPTGLVAMRVFRQLAYNSHAAGFWGSSRASSPSHPPPPPPRQRVKQIPPPPLTDISSQQLLLMQALLSGRDMDRSQREEQGRPAAKLDKRGSNVNAGRMPMALAGLVLMYVVYRVKTSNDVDSPAVHRSVPKFNQVEQPPLYYAPGQPQNATMAAVA